MNDFRLEYPSFQPVKPIKSLIGFLSFKVGRQYSWYKLSVHKLRIPKGNIRIRLVYPDFQGPPDRITQEELDKEANAYLTAQYPEIMREI